MTPASQHVMRVAPHRASGRIHWGVLAFLLGFTALLLLVTYSFLIPGMQAASEATSESERRGLAAYSWLLMVLLLTILVIGLLLTARVRRFFVPGNREPVKTPYVDAWAESGRRAKVPPPETSGMVEEDGNEDP